MKSVLELIRKREAEFAQLPFFEYLRDTSVSPYQRMAWFPCLAHFAMSFKDLNNDILKDNSIDHPIQALINQHSLEDGSHWRWYLKDLETLGIDRVMRFSEALRLIWSDESLKTRQLSHNLVALCRYQSDPVLKLAIIEAIEATGTPALSTMAQVSEELKALTHQRYFYFSPHHVKVETGHIQAGMEHDAAEAFLLSIELTEEQELQALALVEEVFRSFSDCMDGLMHYAQNHSLVEAETRPAALAYSA